MSILLITSYRKEIIEMNISKEKEKNFLHIMKEKEILTMAHYMPISNKLHFNILNIS